MSEIRTCVRFTISSVSDTRYPLEVIGLSGLVADGESGREGRGVVEGGGPDVADSVTDRRVDGEWPVAEDAFHGGNHDSVDSATALRRGSHGLGWFPLHRRRTILSDALWMGGYKSVLRYSPNMLQLTRHAVVIALSPAALARAVGCRRGVSTRSLIGRGGVSGSLPIGRGGVSGLLIS